VGPGYLFYGGWPFGLRQRQSLCSFLTLLRPVFMLSAEGVVISAVEVVISAVGVVISAVGVVISAIEFPLCIKEFIWQALLASFCCKH